MTSSKGWLVAFLLTASVLKAVGAEEGPIQAGGLSFSKPSAWKSLPVASAMRKAQLEVSDEKNGKGEIVFFEFGQGQGGDIKANVDRWFGQFTGDKVKEKSKSEKVRLNGHDVTFVSTEGTFMSGMPGGARNAMENYALEGAIVEAPAGNIFIKFTGPMALVKAKSAEFRKMVESGTKH